MGLWDYMTDPDYRQQFKLGRAAQQNPQIYKDWYAAQQAQAMGPHMEHVYGSPGQAAVPARYEHQIQEMEGPLLPGQERPTGLVNQQITEAQPATPATPGGMFDESIPMRDRILLMNKRMGAVGIPGFTDQWSGNQRAMQKYLMENMGAMTRQQQQQQAELANPQLRRAETDIELFLRDPEAHAARQKAMTRPSTNVTVTDKLRSIEDIGRLKEAENRIQRDIDFVNSTITTGDAAVNALGNLNRMEDILSSGVRTGWGAQTVNDMKRALIALGFDADSVGVAGVEQLQVLFGDAVMARVAETKGAVSNKEMDLFEKYEPSLRKTPAGNLAIIKFQKQRLSRARVMSQYARKWSDEGVRDAEIRRRLNSYMDKYPLKLEVPGG